MSKRVYQCERCGVVYLHHDDGYHHQLFDCPQIQRAQEPKVEPPPDLPFKSLDVVGG